MSKWHLIIYMALVLFVVEPLSAKVFFDPPWGRDADLAYKKRRSRGEQPVEVAISKQGIGVKFGELAIAFHQNVISPADGPRSHFKPSSSQYTLDAMRKYGFLRGWVMGADRLMRENSEEWVYETVVAEGDKVFKFNPVP